MGANSRYTSVSQTDGTQQAGLDQHRSDRTRARDFMVTVDDAEEEDEDVEGEGEEEGLWSRRGTRGKGDGPLSWYRLMRRVVLLGLLTTLALALGFCAGSKHQQRKGCASSSKTTTTLGHEQQASSGWKTGSGGSSSLLLSPLSIVPNIPIKPVKFGFPTPYEDTSLTGDKLWEALMPIGSGFIRVPYPRRYDMPASKPLANDTEESEIYSLSSLHQIHCLAVIRDVIKHYQSPTYAETGPSRFAGNGHEWHCIDYLRQGIMCAGDTTLDFAEDPFVEADGTVRKSRGFTGNNSTHQCRDWDAMVTWAVENRASDRKSIA